MRKDNSIGMRNDVGRHLASLLKPVLASFSDQDARVRYYGCEALYNIAKVARANCVTYFNDIFNGIDNQCRSIGWRHVSWCNCRSGWRDRRRSVRRWIQL